MTCEHGRSDVTPLPADFSDDDDLRLFVGLPDTPQGRALLKKIGPEERRELAQTRAVLREIKAGRIPRGVIACSRGRRR